MKDLTKIKKPFGLLGRKTQAALKAHGGPYQVFWWPSWQDHFTQADFDYSVAYRVKPQPKPIAEPTTEYSTQAEINAAVREFQRNYPIFISDISSKAAIALAALRVPS
jgi:pantothenate kinase-related protein Tda10